MPMQSQNYDSCTPFVSIFLVESWMKSSTYTWGFSYSYVGDSRTEYIKQQNVFIFIF